LAAPPLPFLERMPGVRSSHHGSVFLFVNKFLGVTRQKVGGVRGSVCRADSVIRI
jgi:hypothetical protein